MSDASHLFEWYKIEGSSYSFILLSFTFKDKPQGLPACRMMCLGYPIELARRRSTRLGRARVVRTGNTVL